MLLWLDRKSARLVTTSIINTKSTWVTYQMELFLDNLDFLFENATLLKTIWAIWYDHKYSFNILDIKAKLYTRKLHTWKAWAGSMQGETRLNIPIWYYRIYNIIWHRLFYFIVHYSNPLHSNKSSKWPQLKFLLFLQCRRFRRTIRFHRLMHIEAINTIILMKIVWEVYQAVFWVIEYTLVEIENGSEPLRNL